jgi:hypothetical protein
MPGLGVASSHVAGIMGGQYVVLEYAWLAIRTSMTRPIDQRRAAADKSVALVKGVQI